MVDADWEMKRISLGLSDTGAVGFTMNLGEPYVSFELMYESHPAELLFGAGGLGGVAAAGIVAAIAIPAYQDYTRRAQVAGALAQAQETRAAVTEAHANTGRFPNAAVADGLSRYDLAPPVAAITVEAGTGTIVIEFAPGSFPGDGQLWLEPQAQGAGDLIWQCGGSIEPRYLPALCR